MCRENPRYSAAFSATLCAFCCCAVAEAIMFTNLLFVATLLLGITNVHIRTIKIDPFCILTHLLIYAISDWLIILTH